MKISEILKESVLTESEMSPKQILDTIHSVIAKEIKVLSKKPQIVETKVGRTIQYSMSYDVKNPEFNTVTVICLASGELNKISWNWNVMAKASDLSNTRFVKKEEAKKIAQEIVSKLKIVKLSKNVSETAKGESVNGNTVFIPSAPIVVSI